MSTQQIKADLDIASAYYFIKLALRKAPGLSMLTDAALDAITKLAVDAITEEVTEP